MLKLFAKVYNFVQLFGWLAILILTCYQSIEYEQTGKTDSTLILTLVKAFQISQLTDLLFNILGITSGSIVSNFLQLLGRNVVAILIMHPQLCYCSQRNAIIAWSLAEIIRFSYYISKDNELFKFLRYNAFIVLYPFGITGEIRTINRYIEVFGNETTTLACRVLQAILLIGLVGLYSYMLKMRSKHYGGGANKTKTSHRSSSPQSSRHKRE